MQWGAWPVAGWAKPHCIQQCPPLKVAIEFSYGEGCGLGQGVHAGSQGATCVVG